MTDGGRGLGRPGGMLWAATAVCCVGAVAATVPGAIVVSFCFLGGAILCAAAALALGARRPHAALDQVPPGAPAAFWKHGCPPSSELIRALRGEHRLHWVDVYRDPEADARLRALTGGERTTPTVVVGDEVLREPSADQVRAALDRRDARGG